MHQGHAVRERQKPVPTRSQSWAEFFFKCRPGPGRVGPRRSGPGLVGSAERKWAAPDLLSLNSKCRTQALTYTDERIAYYFLFFVLMCCALRIYLIQPPAANMAKPVSNYFRKPNAVQTSPARYYRIKFFVPNERVRKKESLLMLNKTYNLSLQIFLGQFTSFANSTLK